MTDFQYHIWLMLNQKTDQIAISKRKRSLLFKVWFTDQHGRHLGMYWLGSLSHPSPALLNQNSF